MLVKDFAPGLVAGTIMSVHKAGSSIVVQLENAAGTDELWVSDGTTAGTTQVTVRPVRQCSGTRPRPS